MINWNYKIDLLMIILYNLTILFGTGYVVFGLGRSGWWFLLAVILLASSSSKGSK